MRSRKEEKRAKFRRTDIAVLVVLGLWLFAINRNVHISWPFCDDLYPWMEYAESSFRDFVLPSHAQHLRIVYWLAEWLVFRGIGKNLQLAVVINLLLLSAVSFFLYCFLKKLSGSVRISFLLSLMFATSRFSYYGVSLITGIGEIVALFFVFAMTWLLFDFAGGRSNLKYGFAVLCWLMASLTHERYMVLFPMLLYAAVLRWLRFSGEGPAIFRLKSGIVSGKETLGILLLHILEATALFGLFQLARLKVTGSLLPMGTGGTQLADTFSKKEALKNALSQVAYLFGINAGPTHLNGMSWNETPLLVRGITIMSIVLIICSVWLFFRQLLREKDKAQNTSELKQEWNREIANVCADLLFFTGMIIGCIAAASVTFRVYIRWVYPSFGFCCMILAYMQGFTADRAQRDVFEGEKSAGMSGQTLEVNTVPRGLGAYRVEMSGVLTGLACILMIGCDQYYRENSRDFYIYQDQYRRDSLLEKTWEAFGEEIYDMKIYILGNSYELTEFEKENFYKPSEMLPAALPIEHIGSLEEIPEDETGYIALMEHPVADTYEYAAFVPAEGK